MEDLNRTKSLISPEQEKILPVRWPLNLNCSTSSSLSLQPNDIWAWIGDFEHVSLHNNMTQFLKQTHVHTHTQTHIPYWFCFSGETWLMHRGKIVKWFSSYSGTMERFCSNLYYPYPPTFWGLPASDLMVYIVGTLFTGKLYFSTLLTK